MQRILLRPYVFAAATILFYLALASPVLITHHFDSSAFIVAGDRFVDAAATPSHIRVHPHSEGYDGQFFYRLAQNPLAFETTAFGVTLDKPAFRMSRIVYPALAWALSAGTARFVPAALFGVNLLALGAIAWLGAALARLARLPPLVCVAIVAWPGFFVSLVHDTAEIVACAFMLAAILCHMQRRLFLYVAMAALATLTRETTAPVFAGLLLWDAWRFWRVRAEGPVVIAGVALFVPFVIWRVVLGMVWHVLPDGHSIGQNMGALPFAGLVQTLWSAIAGTRRWAPSAAKDLFVRTVIVVTAGALAGLLAMTAARLARLIRRGGTLAPLALSWVLLAIMIAMLKASGPWVEPAGYLRATTEFYATSLLVLAASGLEIRHSGRMAAGFAFVFVLAWGYSVAQIGLAR